MIDNFAALSVNLPDLLFVKKNNILELLTASYKSQLDQMTDILDKKLSYLQTLKISRKHKKIKTTNQDALEEDRFLEGRVHIRCKVTVKQTKDK